MDTSKLEAPSVLSGMRGMRSENRQNCQQPKADRKQDHSANRIDCQPYDEWDRLPTGESAWRIVIAREAGEVEVVPLIESRAAARAEP
jgi:hypothetical protein